MLKKGLSFSAWTRFRCAAGLDLSACFGQQALHGLSLFLERLWRIKWNISPRQCWVAMLLSCYSWHLSAH